MSQFFSENIGTDQTTVLSGPLFFSDSGAGDPRPFDLVIHLTTPFLYNPAAGNLLLEVRNFGDFSAPFPDFAMDQEATFSEAISSVFVTDLVSPNGLQQTSGLELILK